MLGNVVYSNKTPSVGFADPNETNLAAMVSSKVRQDRRSAQLPHTFDTFVYCRR